MSTTTKKKLSMTKDAIRKRQKRAAERMAKQHEFYRNNPAALASRIAAEIRTDQHANENPDYYDNGTMHWFQQQWAGFKGLSENNLKKVAFKDLHNGNTNEYFEVEGVCPTTGCVAGWAAVLTGNAMLIKSNFWGPDIGRIIDIGEILEAVGTEAGIVFVDDCLDYQTGKPVSIMQVGHKALGLTKIQEDWLFSPTRGKGQVLWALDKLAKGEDFVPYTVGDDPEGCPFDEEGYTIADYEDAYGY